ncbi:MAG: BLUF domain-containing protein [Pseudomonas sp.]|nr:MAG: BLUF domain-containing protein [Pseudomonas sp.]
MTTIRGRTHWCMLSRIIYSSTSLCDAAQTTALVEHARLANARYEITGAIYLSADGTVLQCLEGQFDTVSTLIKKIQCDSRHTRCQILDQRHISSRVFPTWSMAWLQDTPCSRHIRNVIATQNSPPSFLDGSSVGAFFYAMAHSGELDRSNL